LEITNLQQEAWGRGGGGEGERGFYCNKQWQTETELQVSQKKRKKENYLEKQIRSRKKKQNKSGRRRSCCNGRKKEQQKPSNCYCF
jgi:hypothetical protein